jgi:hypothetical protein
MATPFELLDLFIPEIAHWMAGKSTSVKRRFRNAGVGLLAVGIGIAVSSLIFPGFFEWAFHLKAWGYFTSFIFICCGIGLLGCLYIDKKMK